MGEIIERVARIVEAALERHGVTDFEGTTDDARAAIEAMREPTEAMKLAGTARDDGADPTNACGVYEAMIDAALFRSTSKEEGNG